MSEPEITARSTKNEILAAYQAALRQLAEARRENRREEKAQREEKAVVETASATTVEGVVKGLADLKLSIGNALDQVETRLVSEARRLGELRRAIEIERRNLEELHQIQAEAGSLAALIAAQEEKRQDFEREMEARSAAFESEMQVKRAQWKREQEEYERARKEREEQVKRERAREEEEYGYAIRLARKKDEDEYAARRAAEDKALEERRAALEKDWAEREAALAAREQELRELREQVAALPTRLEQAVSEAEARVAERLTAQHRFERELLVKEAESERRLKDQLIDTLNVRIKEQEERIRELTRKADEAAASVQGIALKALEAGAGRRGVEPRLDDGAR